MYIYCKLSSDIVHTRTDSNKLHQFMSPGHQSLNRAGNRAQRGSPRSFYHNRLGEAELIFLSVIFCFFFRVISPFSSCKTFISFLWSFFVFHWTSGSFYHSHLAGLHLLSELGSWDDRSWSSTREISGWSLIKALILTLLLFLIDTDLLFSTIPYLLRQLTDHAARQGRSEVYHGSTFDSLIKLWSWLS